MDSIRDYTTLEKYVLCKYLYNFMDKTLTTHINCSLKGTKDEDENKMIREIRDKFITNNKLYEIYSHIYEELSIAYPQLESELPREQFENNNDCCDPSMNSIHEFSTTFFQDPNELCNKDIHVDNNQKLKKNKIDINNYYRVEKDASLESLKPI